jgi:hypothetical protein
MTLSRISCSVKGAFELNLLTLVCLAWLNLVCNTHQTTQVSYLFSVNFVKVFAH